MAENTGSPFLTVGIPTFNRADYLRDCLESIKVSLALAGDAVDVVVSDNASTDHTPVVVEAARAQGCRITYCRQASNIGAHLNFLEVAKVARGKYVWIFGDDDKLHPDAIARVMGALRAGAEMVVVNAAVCSRDLGRVINPRFIREDRDRILMDISEVAGRFGSYLGFISGVVLDREALLAVPRDQYLAYDEEGTCPLFAAYHTIMKAGRIHFIADPLVINRGDETGGGAAPGDWWERVFARGVPRALTDLRGMGVSVRAIRRAKCRLIFWLLLPRVTLLKRMGISCGPLRDAMRPYMGNVWAFWLIVWPLSLLPPRLYVWLRTVYGFIGKRRG